MQLGKEIGADAYITKPFESKILLEKIEELIKK
jgi:DNA-binding response OmpR family regulator